MVHWADTAAKRVIQEKGNKKKYVCASGITPSGTVHIGNFREIITVDLVYRALKDLGKKVRFIYSWDDYDVFRKIPENMPNKELLNKYLRKPIVDVPDPFGTEKSYARHHEIEIEKDVAKVGIFPEYLYQSEKYKNFEYVEQTKTALQNSDKIKSILDKYRKEPLPKDWMPISGYCPKCNIYDVTFSDYDGNYKLKLHCSECNETFYVDIRKSPFLKLPWRVDWPMRWYYEKVDFEPGGKDHSTLGGSFTTAKEIVKIYNWSTPTYQRYDFVIIKGTGGKISSSKGNVLTLGDCLEIYEPGIIRWFFAGTRPDTEFAISFDLDVIKIYEDFDKCERIYFNKEKVPEKEYQKQKRIYELSCLDKVPKKMPFQPSFRHLTNILLMNSMNIDQTIKYYKLKNKANISRLKQRATCAKNWIEKYAQDDFKFTLNENIPKNLDISQDMKKAFKELAKSLLEENLTDKELHNYFYEIIKKNNLDSKEFFKAAYKILISKEKGPLLASFILTIGKKKVADLFSKL